LGKAAACRFFSLDDERFCRCQRRLSPLR
jgi:hypothetical protein